MWAPSEALSVTDWAATAVATAIQSPLGLAFACATVLAAAASPDDDGTTGTVAVDDGAAAARTPDRGTSTLWSHAGREERNVGRAQPGRGRRRRRRGRHRRWRRSAAASEQARGLRRLPSKSARWLVGLGQSWLERQSSGGAKTGVHFASMQRSAQAVRLRFALVGCFWKQTVTQKPMPSLTSACFRATGTCEMTCDNPVET